MKCLAIFSLISTVFSVPNAPTALSCDNPPSKGYNGPTDTGIFSINSGASGNAAPLPKGATGPAPKNWEFLCTVVNGSAFPNGPDYPIPGIKHVTREGTGPYKSHPAGRADLSLPNHTIFAPTTPPPSDVKLPVIVFGEGSCSRKLTDFKVVQ